MNTATRLIASTTTAAALCLAAGDSSAAKATKKGETRSEAQKPGVIELAEKSDALLAGRTVRIGGQDVVKLKAKIRYTTLIVLPKTEQILDVTIGDKEMWVVNATQNMAYIKPAKEGAVTNLNLIAASGNIYSFILTEVSEAVNAQPDLKVFLDLKDDSMMTASTGLPKFVATESLEECRRQVDLAKEETKRTQQASKEAIEGGISRFIANVRFPYHFEAGKKPFRVRAMYHDDKFTYIQARPEETPVLYEIKDKKPNVIQFEYRNGAYVVPKILDRGYLAIGKQTLDFSREE